MTKTKNIIWITKDYSDKLNALFSPYLWRKHPFIYNTVKFWTIVELRRLTRVKFRANLCQKKWFNHQLAVETVIFSFLIDGTLLFHTLYFVYNINARLWPYEKWLMRQTNQQVDRSNRFDMRRSIAYAFTYRAFSINNRLD